MTVWQTRRGRCDSEGTTYVGILRDPSPCTRPWRTPKSLAVRMVVLLKLNSPAFAGTSCAKALGNRDCQSGSMSTKSMQPTTITWSPGARAFATAVKESTGTGRATKSFGTSKDATEPPVGGMSTDGVNGTPGSKSYFAREPMTALTSVMKVP